MKYYDVTITKKATITVEASNKEEAEDMALALCADYEVVVDVKIDKGKDI